MTHGACYRLTAANWLQFYEAATPMRGRKDRAGRSGKTFPIDFANKLAVAKRGTRCQSVVRLRTGNLEPCGQIAPFVNLFCIVTF